MNNYPIAFWDKQPTQMAERKGFEPSKACTLHAFQACSFNHSDTSLKMKAKFYTIKNKKALNPTKGF